MRVPSYDDLAPSIPDVDPGDLLAVERLLPAPAPIAWGGGEVQPGPLSCLFACLYAPEHQEAAVAIAREFSPRYQRYGTDSVVLDVSGLGRLLGDPPAIAAELARAVSIMACPRLHLDAGHTHDSPRTTPRALRATSRYGIRIQPQSLEGSDHGPRTTARGIFVAVAPTQIAALLLARTGGARVVGREDMAAALGAVPIEALRQLVVTRFRGFAAPARQADRPAFAVSPLRRGKPDNRTPERPNDRTPERPNDRTPERPNDRTPERPDARTIERPSHRTSWPPREACEQAFDTLARWGLRTLGEFSALPAADLSARMGQAGVRLQALARGVDLQPLVPEPDAPRFVEQMELEWPIDGLEPLSFVLARLLDPLTAALERADRAAAALRLDLRLTDRTTHRCVLQLPAALRDARVFRTLLVLDLESRPPHAAIDVVAIEIDPAPARVLQYSLLDPATASAETLATLTARLRALVGESRCGSPGLLDTHRPDGFEMRPFAPDDRRIARDRPGDRPDGPACCLRRFRPPVAIRVAVEHGRPVYVAIDRRGMPGGRVEQSAGPWRTSGAWWRAPGEAWNHDEWDVTFSEGTTVRLSRERITGRWFLEAVVD